MASGLGAEHQSEGDKHSENTKHIALTQHLESASLERPDEQHGHDPADSRTTMSSMLLPRLERRADDSRDDDIQPR